MKFGLSDADISYIKSIIANFKTGSDIDICIKGKYITFDTAASLKANLEDMGPMPYQIDIVIYELLESIELKQHIDQFGIEL